MNPIVIGLAGKAASGKTTIADMLVTTASVSDIRIDDEEETKSANLYTKLSFAIPLKRIVSIRTQTKGVDEFSRQCFGIHNVVYDLIPTLKYDDLIEMTYDIASYVLNDERKPRTFLQWLGDLFREYDENVFVHWMARQIKLEEHYLEDGQQLVVVIDDVRFPNEAELINSYTRGYLIRLEVSPDIQLTRLIERDGERPNPASFKHQSEVALDDYLFKYKLDTSNETPLNTKQKVLDITLPNKIESLLQGYINAKS